MQHNTGSVALVIKAELVSGVSKARPGQAALAHDGAMLVQWCCAHDRAGVAAAKSATLFIASQHQAAADTHSSRRY